MTALSTSLLSCLSSSFLSPAQKKFFLTHIVTPALLPSIPDSSGRVAMLPAFPFPFVVLCSAAVASAPFVTGHCSCRALGSQSLPAVVLSPHLTGFSLLSAECACPPGNPPGYCGLQVPLPSRSDLLPLWPLLSLCPVLIWSTDSPSGPFSFSAISPGASSPKPTATRTVSYKPSLLFKSPAGPKGSASLLAGHLHFSPSLSKIELNSPPRAPSLLFHLGLLPSTQSPRTETGKPSLPFIKPSHQPMSRLF